MSNTSILSAINKMRSLLTREEKFTWLGIVGFAFLTSSFEAITAFVIVLFSQVINQPELGQRYLTKLGFPAEISRNRIIFYMAIIVGLIYLIKNMIAAMEVFYQNFSIQKMNYKFKNKLLRRYAESDYNFYLTRNSSVGMQVVSGDAEQMFASAMIPLASILSESIVFLFLVSMIIFMNPSLAFIIFGTTVVLGFLIIKYLLPKFYNWGSQVQTASLYSYQNLMQFFHAFKEIVLLGKRDAFVHAYQIHSRQKSNIQALQTAANSMPRMVIEVMFVGLFVISILFLCMHDEAPVQMIGVLGGYLYVGFRLMPGLNRIINHANTFKTAIPCVESVYREYNVVPAKSNYLNIEKFSFNSAINIRNVCFSYINSHKQALTNINLDILKGERIGVIGETGSGKSTLIDVILGLLKPISGFILIDNEFPVNCYQWHKHIGYVPQSIYLTDDTIEANIAFGESKIDQDSLNTAINAAQLRKFIDQLPQGTKTLVGERGVRLSGGERQRIAIARALYRNPSVLIFDEATSALDNDTEEKLMETIDLISVNRTVIMVAHRLSTLKGCGRIIELENGKVKLVTDYNSIKSIGINVDA